MVQRVKGILFDLGDTLFDFGKVDIGHLFEAGARLAYDYLLLLGQKVPSFSTYHRRQLWAIRWNYFKSHFTGREFNALDLIGRRARRMGHDLSDEQMRQLAWLWYRPLGQQAKVEPGLAALLQGFGEAGLKLAVVSNTFVPGQVLDRHLEAEGLLKYLPVRVYSCDVRYRKPDRRIFHMALERAGLQASETLFVGDSPEADIRGANAVGMISVLKNRTARLREPRFRPQHQIRQLSELKDLLAKYNGR